MLLSRLIILGQRAPMAYKKKGGRGGAGRGQGRHETEASIDRLIGQICHGELEKAKYGAVTKGSPKIREAQDAAFRAAETAMAKNPQDASRLKYFLPGSNDREIARLRLRADVATTFTNTASIIEKKGRVREVRQAPGGSRARAIAETKATIFKMSGRHISTDKVLNSLKTYRRWLRSQV